MNPSRRVFLAGLISVAAVGLAATPSEAAGFFDFLNPPEKSSTTMHRAVLQVAKSHKPHKSVRRVKLCPVTYEGAKIVDYASIEKPGTIIIRTNERALYRILEGGKAKRYGVAVGKDGFQWAGVARVGLKRENPTWTPPAEMIERQPQYQKWAAGMPGGLPINPLGPRAMYLFDGGDTGFRIHGTIHPESIGHAASSGCIRMLNREVIELYDMTRVGTKVIVL